MTVHSLWMVKICRSFSRELFREMYGAGFCEKGRKCDMLRFCGKKFMKPDGLDIVIAEESIRFDKDLWRNSRMYFKNYFSEDVTIMRLLPIVDGNGNLVCYGWQDGEANRELRMIKELSQNRELLQFHNVFKEVREVVVCGCNELAYSLVKYLETQRIKVSVEGKYWDFFGYESITVDEICSGNTMIIYAEGRFQHAEWYQRIVRSASPEFECIDKIYETNVSAGKIKDSGGGLEWFLAGLKDKQVVLFGTGTKAQDTYDFLYSQGIDIRAFVEKYDYGIGEDGGRRTLLGKPVFNIGHAVSCMEEDVVIVSSVGKGNALGTELTDKLDYYGFERNRQFFLIDDYTDVPYSNLVHILKGKVVLLSGDQVLCRILQKYLELAEEYQIVVKHIEIDQCSVASNEIVCVVHPWVGLADPEYNLRLRELNEKLKKVGKISYTMYFSYARAFVIANEYLCRGMKKYTVEKLIPKGVLLGAIPAVSGNFLVRGILDGHPDIMMLPYNDWNNNLFLYCLCLANEKAENIVGAFKDMVNRYVVDADYVFSDWVQFQANMEELLAYKEQFTSQELFLIFHIAYAAMMSGRKIADVSPKVIYWEPHCFDRMDFPFLAKWLESSEINGTTLVMRRDGITYCGSQCKFETKYNLPAFFKSMSIDYLLNDTVSERVACQYWKELKMRFEDLKLHPVEELSEICKEIEILWSDTMLHTTINGDEWKYGGIKDFDLKPVFNKYEEYFSEFDRFRISVICSAYQKKYGYIYGDCMEFSRSELWDMFLKEFRFQKERQFMDEKEKMSYFLSVYEIMRWQLWNARKHVVLDDISPEFEPLRISPGKN